MPFTGDTSLDTRFLGNPRVFYIPILVSEGMAHEWLYLTKLKSSCEKQHAWVRANSNNSIHDIKNKYYVTTTIMIFPSVTSELPQSSGCFLHPPFSRLSLAPRIDFSLAGEWGMSARNPPAPCRLSQLSATFRQG
jgi:hypothetical protein